jgi:hypothetical protein
LIEGDVSVATPDATEEEIDVAGVRDTEAAAALT